MTNDPMDVLSALLAGAVDILDIPDHVRDAAVDRYEHVGNHLATSGGPEWSIYPQGSFITGTVIRPPTSDSEYDIDLVCHHDIEKESITQAVLKKQVGAMLEEYFDLCTSTVSPYAPDEYFEKRRCWTLAYDALGFHLDVLPAIPDVELRRSRNGILLTDNKLRPWQHGNPKDFATWFRNRSEEMRRKLEAKAREANVATVPDWAVRSTLQRLVQVLKWHIYVAFADDVDDRPPSVLITTLAARAYRGEENLGRALLDVVNHLPDHIDRTNGRWEVLNPAHDKENFCDKWNEPDTAHRRIKFMAWHEKALKDLESAYDTRDAGIDALVRNLGGSFGQELLQKAAADWAGTTMNLRATGKLTVATGTGMLGIGLGRRSPVHTFHGRETS